MSESRLLKRTSFFNRHCFSIVLFLFLLVFHIVIVNRLKLWRLSDLTYSLFCVDFSFGFASKLLPGAIFNTIFASHANRFTANVYAVVLILLVFIGVSVLLERFIMSMPEKHKMLALALVVFFLSGAYSLSIYTKWLGVSDTYWIVLLLLFFFFIDRKWLRLLIPIIYITALMIHFSSLVFFIPIFSIILLYRIAVSSDKSEKKTYGIIFVVSICVSIIFFFFLILSEAKYVCPIEEFHEKMKNHGTTFFTYYDYAFFHILYGEELFPSVDDIQSPLLKFFYMFYYQVRLCFKLFFNNVVDSLSVTIGGLVLIAPMITAFLCAQWKYFKQKSNGLRRFVAFLMMLQVPFSLILGVLFAISADITRYYTYLMIGVFTYCLAVLYYEEDKREDFFDSLKRFMKTPAALIYFLYYSVFTLMPCL